MNALGANTTLQDGKYRIIEVLGHGGFGITYLAEQVMLGRQVCIKEFFYKECCDREENSSHITMGTQANKNIVQRFLTKFLKEARTISLLDHPNIVKIHDIFEENNTAYYVMEYIDGENLSELVKHQGQLDEVTAVEYVTKVAKALKYIHNKSINHLDVKPGNVMLRKSDGEIILIDFGLAKQYDESGSQTSSTPIGITEGFAPIEQYRAGGVASFSPQTDIYSLGATLYWLVIGQRPVAADVILDEGFPELPNYISEPVQNAIRAAMQARKKDRPSCVDKWLGILLPDSEYHDYIDSAEDGPSTTTIDDDDEDSAEETVIVGVEMPGRKEPEAHTSHITSGSTSGVKPAHTNGGKTGGSSKMIWIIAAVVFVIALAVGAILASGGSKDTDEPEVAVVDNQYYEDNANGSYYWTGEAVNSVPNGHGEATFLPKDKFGRKSFTGEVANGLRVKGTLKYTNGDYYEGTFTKNEFNEGTYYSFETSECFKGTFKDSSPYNGKWYDKNNKVIGTVTNGK